MGSVVSMAVAPPDAVGAYLSTLTIRETVSIVNSSLRKFAAKPRAPHFAPKIWLTSGPVNVYHPYPAVTAVVATTLIPRINALTKPLRIVPNAIAKGTINILGQVRLILEMEFLSIA